eukprot:gene32738-42391_t
MTPLNINRCEEYKISEYSKKPDNSQIIGNDNNYNSLSINKNNIKNQLNSRDVVSPFSQSLSFPEVVSVKQPESSSIFPLGSSNISLISFTISELELTRLSEAKIIPQNKAVSFCRTVRVCLVPSRICLAPYCQDLFWSPDDYKAFKDEAIKEIKSVLDARRRVGDKCSPRDVKNALYQPTIYPDLSQSLLTPEETKSERESKLIMNLESDFKAEVLHSSSVDKPISRPQEAPAADPKGAVINNTYRGQPTPTQQHQYAYPYQLHQQYPQDQGVRYHSAYTEHDASLRIMRRVDSVQLFKPHPSSSSPPRSTTSTATNSAGSRRQRDLTVIPAVLA